MIENAGSATWRSLGAAGVRLAYHWLDLRGNAIVWDGIRTTLPHAVEPGATIELDVDVLAPRPPGPYRLAFDLLEEHRFWFSEIGAATLDLAVDVAPRIAARRLAVHLHGPPDDATTAALAAQEEPLVEHEPTVVAHLVSGARPSPDWSRLVLDAHEEGWAAVGVAIVSDQRAPELGPWRGGGRNPRFGQPLLCPSLALEFQPSEHLGLPAYDGPDGLFDGRAAIRLPRRSGRRRS